MTLDALPGLVGAPTLVWSVRTIPPGTPYPDEPTETIPPGVWLFGEDPTDVSGDGPAVSLLVDAVHGGPDGPVGEDRSLEVAEALATALTSTQTAVTR